MNFKPDARVAVAVFGITRAHLDSTFAAAVFDLNKVAVAPLLHASHRDRFSIIGCHNHVTRYVRDADMTSSADAVGFFEILSRSRSCEGQAENG